MTTSYELVTDTPAPPPIWRDMTDAEKGELLLADHEGETIEYYDSHLSSWLVDHGFDPHQKPDVRYRVAEPEPKEPREWWIVGGCEAWDNQADAINSAKTSRHSDVVHVREVIK